MAIALSVNLNKIALLRNSRETTIPDVLLFARLAIEAGADGITVHPRSDGRHTRPSDVRALKELLADYPGVEFNIEGNPFSGVYGESQRTMLDLALEVKPHQVTLVPDSDGQLTSDSGWKVAANKKRLTEVLDKIRDAGSRSSVFMDADSDELGALADCGADRVELYTGPYADNFGTGLQEATFKQFAAAAKTAASHGLGVNAGHDLNLDNLPLFSTIPEILEVSIGHALTVDALLFGFSNVVGRYKKILADV